MANDVPADLAEKAAIMREFGRRRAAGEPVSDDLLAKRVNATNDNYATGPEPGERLPDFALPDQNGVSKSLAGLAGSNRLAFGISSQCGLVTLLPIPTGRVGTIPFDVGEEWRPHRGGQL
jgi:hypothetical protein